MGEVKLSRHTGWLGVGVTAASALCLLLQQSNQVKAATVDSTTATAAVVVQPDQAAPTGTPTTETVVPTATATQADYSTTQAQADATTQALAPVQTAFNTYATAVTDYNAALTDQASTAGTQATDQSLQDQQTAAAAVTTAQTALADTLIPAVQTTVTDYQTTATAYQAAAGATPVVDLTALTDLQTQLKQLTTVAHQDQSVTLTANQSVLAMADINGVYTTLQDRVNVINNAAVAQNQAADAWNQKVAAAQADGRWALFFNGDDGLLNLANKLIAANNAYKDALNGTTTTLTTKTITDPDTGKTFKMSVVDTITEGTTPSLTDVVTQYDTTIDQYNTTYSQTLPDAQAVLDGIDAATLSSDFDTDNVVLMSKVEDMLTQIGKLAADPAQNKIVTNRLDATSETFSGTTDGSSDPIYNPNTATAQVSLYLTLLIGESNYTTLSTHTVNSASVDIGNYTAGASTTIFDYGPDVTGPNGVVKTTLKKQQAVLERFWNAEYTDIPAQFAAMNAGQPMPATATVTGVPTTLTLDGVDYYLAAYSILAQNNAMMQVSKTTEVYTFETTDPKAEFEANPLLMPANKNNNMRLFFYFMPVSALPADFAVEATAAQSLSTTFTPTTNTLKKLTVPTVTLTVPNPIPITDPTSTEGEPAQPDPTPAEDQPTQPDPTSVVDQPIKTAPTPTEVRPIQTVPTQVAPPLTAAETNQETSMQITATVVENQTLNIDQPITITPVIENQPMLTKLPLVAHKTTITVEPTPLATISDPALQSSSKQVVHTAIQQRVSDKQLPVADISARPYTTPQYFAADPLQPKPAHAASNQVTQSQAIQSGTPHLWSEPAILPVTPWLTAVSTATLPDSQVQPAVIVDDALDAILAPKHRLPGADSEGISMLGQFFISLSGTVNFGLKV